MSDDEGACEMSIGFVRVLLLFSMSNLTISFSTIALWPYRTRCNLCTVDIPRWSCARYTMPKMCPVRGRRDQGLLISQF